MSQAFFDELAESVENCFRERIGHRVTGVVVKDSTGTEHPPGRRRVFVEFEDASPILVIIEMVKEIPWMMVMDSKPLP